MYCGIVSISDFDIAALFVILWRRARVLFRRFQCFGMVADCCHFVFNSGLSRRWHARACQYGISKWCFCVSADRAILILLIKFTFRNISAFTKSNHHRDTLAYRHWQRSGCLWGSCHRCTAICVKVAHFQIVMVANYSPALSILQFVCNCF